jgi:hypothetical protein
MYFLLLLLHNLLILLNLILILQLILLLIWCKQLQIAS